MSYELFLQTLLLGGNYCLLDASGMFQRTGEFVHLSAVATNNGYLLLLHAPSFLWTTKRLPEKILVVCILQSNDGGVLYRMGAIGEKKNNATFVCIEIGASWMSCCARARVGRT